MPRAKKSLGQNFLTDKAVIRRIIEAADLSDEDVVLEIGPGPGALTAELVKTARRVIAVELDRELAAMLRDRFHSYENFQLIENDALELDLTGLVGLSHTKLKVVANLPYYISTAILTHLIDMRRNIGQMILMLQREVVERITAEPGNSDRGYLTVITEAYVDVVRLFDVAPSAFRPEPKVWSSVIRVTPRPLSAFDRRGSTFRALVSAAFAHKRKTLQNNLRHSADELGIGDVAALLERASVDPAQRAEMLTLDEWERILNQLHN